MQVPVGGCYRLIDIPMSNCINSGINKIFVLTQFNSASLNRHISRTYFGNGVSFGDGIVEVGFLKQDVWKYVQEISLITPSLQRKIEVILCILFLSNYCNL